MRARHLRSLLRAHLCSALCSALRVALPLGLSLLAPRPAAAQEVHPQPELSLSYSNLFAARANPLGLVDYARFSLRLRLYESEEAILAQNYVGFGVAPAISPSWGRLGVLVEVQPLTILRLWAQYDFIGWYGSFNFFSSYPTASADYSDTAVEERVEIPGLESYATYGGILTLGSLVQMKVGPVAARNTFQAIYTSYQMRDGDRTYYDPIMDIMMPNDGWMVTNDLDLLGLIDIDDQINLALGARWTFTHAFYESRHYLPFEDPDTAPNNEIHRFGPAAALRLLNDPGARFDQPTIILILQWHLVHRFRTGADVDVGLPYIAGAFSFQGDLLSPR